MSIKFENVSYHTPFDRAFGLNELSFEIMPGEFVGVMGLEGSGKSSLLRLMSGLETPGAGRILFNGDDMKKRSIKSVLRSKIRLLLEKPELMLFESTVERELSFALRGSGIGGEDLEKSLRCALEITGFAADLDIKRSPLSFSRSEKCALAFAAALVGEPEYILLDDTLSSFGPAEREKMMELLVSLNERGVTVVLATNDAELLSRCARRVLVLEKGRLIRDDSARALFTDYFFLLRHSLPNCRVRQLAQCLRERDVNMPANIMSYEQFIDRLKIIMWRKKK